MNREAIETALYENACEHLTARQTKEALRKLGATVDLRTWIDNTIDIFDLAGDFVFTAEI